MGNANAAQEPSMEEILASIRQIISEEGSADFHGSADNEGDGAAGHGTGGAPRAHERPSIRIAERSGERAAAQGGALKLNGASTARSAERPAYAAPVREPVPHIAPDAGDVRLISDGVDQAVSTSFSALAHTILAQNARTLEDLVSEMLQPMLREWLDDNLPTLVERIVQDEIQRVSRGRR